MSNEAMFWIGVGVALLGGIITAIGVIGQMRK